MLPEDSLLDDARSCLRTAPRGAQALVAPAVDLAVRGARVYKCILKARPASAAEIAVTVVTAPATRHADFPRRQQPA